ncbi:RTA1 domain protein [Rasamsonia emersonii CBS 393.64]|uniref:RTA1 domain protein n=1 Tax=Rasamsonia emersonii (strain ATCC 16479 / CBS 393.64 / IMI 116815) TaxID=1408163 RepID=A0A0F4YN04_RASE3|nr:RTA1 domain protein [Rasamsonia emersonii CBS 393.64]KKA19632.1 RTA1 domain protein [Rasamsonia emersonii CBS 393.64]
MPRFTCTEVTPLCPVSKTTLGYYPNLGANAFFCAGFAVCALWTLTVGVWKHTSTYMMIMIADDDDAGYIGRIMLHHNPWSSNGFKIQIVCIILAPTLICAGIYLTLKHVARTVGPDLSRLKPRFYTWLFIPFDVFCLCLQAIGGGVDAAASSSGNINENQLRVGNDIIIAGIVLQVVNLAVFGLLSVDFFWRAKSHFRRNSCSSTSPGAEIWHSKRFRIFCTAVTGAYTGILIRCIYRIAEMSGGWGNPVMRNEVLFIVLEGVMVLYPAFILTIFAPGFFFPEMANNNNTSASNYSSSSSSRITAGPDAEEKEEKDAPGTVTA